MVAEGRVGVQEAPLIPACVAVEAEEVGPQVVVHTVNLPAVAAEGCHDFGPDEARGAADE